jgi:hypothetical protein
VPAHPVSRLVGFTLRSAQTCFSTTSLEAAYSPPRAHGRGRRAGRLPTSSTSPSRPASASPSAALSVTWPSWPLIPATVTVAAAGWWRGDNAALSMRSPAAGSVSSAQPGCAECAESHRDRRSRDRSKKSGRRSRWPPIPSHRRGAVRSPGARTVGSFGCPECESWGRTPIIRRRSRTSSIVDRDRCSAPSRSGPSARQQKRRRRAFAAKVPTAADLGKQFRVRGDVLLDGLRGLTGDLFDVMGGAVVAVLAMQTHHGRQMLLNEV